MHGVTNRAEFAVALIRGLGGTLKDSAREALAKEVLGWVGESIPSGEQGWGGEPTFRILNFFDTCNRMKKSLLFCLACAF